jgi:VTC domain
MTENNLDIKRHELKYFINPNTYHLLVDRVKPLMDIDPHSTPHQGYFIRSLYFDAWDDACLYEKQSGVKLRQKYRLRLYDTAADRVKLEIKNKTGDLVHKESAWVSKNMALAMQQGDYEPIRRQDNPVLTKIYHRFITEQFRPKVTVDYYRDAFTLPHHNIRVTFDKHIASNTTCFNLFSNDLITTPIWPDNRIVLEIKFDTYYPDTLRYALELDQFTRAAISKYALSRRFMKQHPWEDQ